MNQPKEPSKYYSPITGKTYEDKDAAFCDEFRYAVAGPNPPRSNLDEIFPPRPPNIKHEIKNWTYAVKDKN